MWLKIPTSVVASAWVPGLFAGLAIPNIVLFQILSGSGCGLLAWHMVHQNPESKKIGGGQLTIPTTFRQDSSRIGTN